MINNSQFSTVNSQLPKGWEIKKLGEVLQKTETVNPKLKPNEEFIYIDVSSVNKETKKIEKTQLLFGRNAPSRARKLVKTNDIIFATVRPTHSRVAIITEKYNNQVCSTGYYVLKAKECLNNRFIYFFLLTYGFNKKMENLQKGASYPAVTNKEVESIEIPLPPLPEQQRIVAILDKCFAVIERSRNNAQQNLLNAKELFESYLQNVFENKGDDWEEKTLGEVCEIVTGKLNANAMVHNGEYMFFTCSRDTYLINDYAFDCEAILLAGNNASGDFNVKHYKGKFNAYQRTYVIMVKDSFNYDYSLLKHRLEYHLKVFKRQSVGANTRFLKIGMIKGVQIFIPSIKEQQQIVKKLNSLSAKTKKLETIYQQKINDLEELKKSVLDKAFKGEL